MIATVGIRWTGEKIPRIALGQCNVPGCMEIAYSENCNAEGDENRMHWHGTLHVPSGMEQRFGGGQLCPAHAEECRAAWRARA